jgi:uncharacterized protein (DUF885 family)
VKNETLKTFLLLGACALALAASASPPPRKKAQAARRESFASLRDRYVKAFLSRFPVVATYLGASGLDRTLEPLDGRLRDYRPEALRAERAEWETTRTALSRVDKAKLTLEERIDADVMEAQLAFLLSNLDRRLEERALDVVLEEPVRGTEWLLQGMTQTGAATYGTASEWESLRARVVAIPPYLEVALVNLRRGAAGDAIPDRHMIRVGEAAARTTVEYYEKALPEKVSGWTGDAETRRRVSAASAAAAKAFRDFRDGLVALYFAPPAEGSSALTLKKTFDRDRFAMGEAAYSWALKNNLRVARTPRELHAYGKQRVAETLAAMTTLARSIAAKREWPDASLPGVFARLSEEVPKSDEEMLSWYRDATQRLVEYARKTGMFAPPADYKLDVVFTPPPLRDTLDAAYYPAPPFKKTGVGQFYVTPTGDDPAKLREHARAAIASLAAHEGFPGHDWYYKFMQFKGAAISPVRWLTPGGVEDSASMWEDSMSAEGWALYCEQLVGEARPGFPEGFYTPEERLFQLQNQLLRDARVVVDTGIHCGYMSFDDAVGYFARNVHFVKGPVSTDSAVNPSAAERADVEASQKAIYRYSKWPTQAITYHLGKAAILELREETRKIEGDAFDERRFHEAFLSQGSIPPGYFGPLVLDAARARAGAR